LFSDSIWKNTKSSNPKVESDSYQYYTNYEKIKKKYNKNKTGEKERNKDLNTLNVSSERIEKEDISNYKELNDDYSYSDDNISVSEEEKAIINKINSIHVKSNKFVSSKEKQINKSNSNIQNRQICMTEPDEIFYNHTPYFSDNLQQIQSNKTPQQNKTFTPSYLFFPHPLQINLMNQFKGNSQCLNNKGSFVSTQYSSNKMYMSNDLSDEICEDAERDEK
jgi:hypothetical protein